MKKTQNLENLHVFCEIVRAGSVKAASDALNTETSNAFRTVRQLEDELGVTLFDREKRPMQLTAYGTQFYRYSSKILKLHHQMLEELKDDTEAMAGRITVCSTAGFRQQFLTPCLVEFQMDHPNIVIDLREMNSGVSDVLNNATESGNDVVLMYKPQDALPAGMEVRECGVMPFIACASPLYIKRFGEPTHPAECRNHRGVLLNLPNRKSVTYLTKDGVQERLSWRRTMTFNSQINARDAMLMDAGIIPDLAFYFAIQGIKEGQIVPVMPGWTRPPRISCLFATEDAYRKKRVRYFLDWLEVRFRKMLEHTNREYQWVA